MLELMTDIVVMLEWSCDYLFFNRMKVYLNCVYL